jgi:SagB-type dehydrogenase family enzyme
MNKHTSSAYNYHEATKHSEISLMTQRHYLDFNNRPIPFKIYITDFPRYLLPSDLPRPLLDAIMSISDTNPKVSDTGSDPKNLNYLSKNSSSPDKSLEVDIKDLAEVLFFSAGITRAIKYDSTTYYMRAASATGALYPIELYVVCCDIPPDLRAGVYHFNPADFSLTQIRDGDYRQQLSASIADSKSVLESPISLILTSLAWRNAWKYQSRSYRHWFWDSGVIVANLLATTKAMGLISRLYMGFVDDTVNRLLCLESHKEAAIAIGTITIEEKEYTFSNGLLSGQLESEKEIPEMSIPNIRPLSKGDEIDYPEIWTLHEDSKLFSKEEVKEWTNRINYNGKLFASESNGKDSSVSASGLLNRQPLLLTNQNQQPNNIPDLAEVILRRGSTRKFAMAPVPLSTLSTILHSSTRGISIDFLQKTGHSLIDLYLISNNIQDLTPGGYFFNRKHRSLDMIKMNVSRQMSGYLCLGQPLFSQASAVLFLMTDLQKVLEALGNRGYRASQFEAGIIAGKIYLAAYAQGIGASGSTFFDDAVTEFFSPHAANKSTMIVVGIGKAAYMSRPGRILPVRLTREELLKMNS